MKKILIGSMICAVVSTAVAQRSSERPADALLVATVEREYEPPAVGTFYYLSEMQDGRLMPPNPLNRFSPDSGVSYYRVFKDRTIWFVDDIGPDPAVRARLPITAEIGAALVIDHTKRSRQAYRDWAATNQTARADDQASHKRPTIRIHVPAPVASRPLDKESVADTSGKIEDPGDKIPERMKELLSDVDLANKGLAVYLQEAKQKFIKEQ